MKTITKLLLTAAFLVLGIGGAKSFAQTKTGLADLETAYGQEGAWASSINLSYPVSVLDVTIFGSDANEQTTNANVNNYDYIYFEVTNFRAERAVRVFFWDPNGNKRLDYYLKPVANKDNANYEAQTTVTGNGTYCVKIPDGARLQGAKTPWVLEGASEPYFKFSEIYLTERATPYVELVPYTLVYTNGKAEIPISESHIRTTGNVSIDYTTGEITNTGSGTLVIYLNNENLIGATLYHVDFEGTNLEPTLDITDAVNSIGRIWGSRFNWNIAGDAERRDKIGAVKSFTYNFSNAGSMTFKSIYILADELIAETATKDLTSLPFGLWGAPANKVSNYISKDTYVTNNINGKPNGLIYGHDGIEDANKYVDLTNCKKLIFTGLSSDGKLRLFYNWDGTETGKTTETITDFPFSSSTYILDIDKFKKEKGITFFHLNAIKASAWNTSATISEIKVEEYTNKISGKGIDRTKNYLSNPYLTSIDATGVTTTGITLTPASPNTLIVANAGVLANNSNVIVDGTCANLVLTDGYPFKAPADFTATTASYTTTINTTAGAGTLCLPFDAEIPEGVTAWSLHYTGGDEATATQEEEISANKPVLLNGSGEVTFTGSSAAITADADNANGALIGVFEKTTINGDNLVLQMKDGETEPMFYQVETTFDIDPFRAYLKVEDAILSGNRLGIVYSGTVNGIQTIEQEAVDSDIYDLQGRRVAKPNKGLYIVGGKKVIK